MLVEGKGIVAKVKQREIAVGAQADAAQRGAVAGHDFFVSHACAERYRPAGAALGRMKLCVMSIVIHLDLMLAKRKVKSKDLAAFVGIMEQNLSLLKSGKVKAYALARWRKSASTCSASRAT